MRREGRSCGYNEAMRCSVVGIAVMVACAALACGDGKERRTATSGPAEVTPAVTPVATPAPVPAPAPVDFSLSLALTDGENSKDSHSQRVRCEITDRAVTYYGPHGACERGQCPHAEVSFELTEPQRTALLDAVARLDLYTTFEEQKSTELLGSYVKLVLEVRLDERRGRVEVAGMQRGLGDDSQDLSDDARAWVGKAEDLRRELLPLVAPHLPDAH